MFIIQLHNEGQFQDWVDGFESYQDAHHYALTSMADIFQDDYGSKWRIVAEDCDDGELYNYGDEGRFNRDHDREDFHSDG